MRRLKILTILDESVKDNATGQYSHARIIALLIAFGATIFMWKLIILGGMQVEYFLGYLAYGTGHQALNKYLDNSDPQRHARDTQQNKNEDPSLRPPKN